MKLKWFLFLSNKLGHTSHPKIKEVALYIMFYHYNYMI
jgi:hypothetical protein